jgi:hypothetical protein
MKTIHTQDKNRNNNFKIPNSTSLKTQFSVKNKKTKLKTTNPQKDKSKQTNPEKKREIKKITKDNHNPENSN